MSGLRTRRADLSRLRHGESGTTVAQIFPTAVVRRMDADSMTRKDAYRETLRRFPRRQDRYSRRHANDRERPALSKRDARRYHQRRSGLASAGFPRRRAHVPISHPGRRSRRPRRDRGRSFRANVHTVHPSIQFARHHDFAGYFQQELEFANAAIFRLSSTRSSITVRSAHEGRAQFSRKHSPAA